MSFLIIAFFAPPMISLMEGFGGEADIDTIDEQVRGIVETVHRTYYSGEGSEAYFAYDIPDGYGISLGGNGADAYTIRLTSDGEIVATRYIENPVVAVVTDTDLSGSGTVGFCCKVDEGGLYVEAV